MSEKTGLEYPKLDNEVITVKNFMVIKEATMKCGDITVLVGEQATGKSLLAKLRYFFWDYQEGLLSIYSVFTRVNNLDPKYIKEYNKTKITIFCEIFSNIENMKDKFFIKFKSGEISITIKRDDKDSKIKISFSKYLKDIVKDIEEMFETISTPLNGESIHKFNTNKELLKKRAEKERRDLMGKQMAFLLSRIAPFSVPTVLYVPAQRLFLATIQENPYKLLDSKNYNFDFLLKQFGVFWGISKKSFSAKFKDSKKNELWFGNAHKILSGDYVHKDETDYIKTTWGETVELKDASSGQQEVLPLLFSIHDFPHKELKNQLLIIEEPEAHLYPTAQRALVKMIAEVARKKGCKVMITTHSPYIPACVNNEIKIADNEEDSLDVTAYHVSDATVEDIYYKKYNLINVNKLDEASTQIANEYCEQLAIKTKKSKDKADKNHA